MNTDSEFAASRTRVLLVDDEVGLLKTAKIYLEATGELEILIESDSRKAIRTAEQCDPPPDIIILDLLMPKLGNEIGGELRLHPKLKDIPILYLTGSEKLIKRSEMPPDGKMCGVEIIMKPIKPKQLRERLLELARRERGK